MNNFNSNTAVNQSRDKDGNAILKDLVKFYKTPAIKLAKHLREKHNYTLEQLAEVMGMSKQAVSTNYLPSEQSIDSNNNKRKVNTTNGGKI